MNLKVNLKQAILDYLESKPIQCNSFNIGILLNGASMLTTALEASDFVIHYTNNQVLSLTTSKTIDKQPKTLNLLEVCKKLNITLPANLTENYIANGLPGSLNAYPDQLAQLFNFKTTCCLFESSERLNKMLNWAIPEFENNFDIYELLELLINNIAIDNKKCLVSITGRGIFTADNIELKFKIDYYWDNKYPMMMKNLEGSYFRDSEVDCYLSDEYLEEQMLSFNPQIKLKDAGYFIQAKELSLTSFDRFEACISKESASISKYLSAENNRQINLPNTVAYIQLFCLADFGRLIIHALEELQINNQQGPGKLVMNLAYADPNDWDIKDSYPIRSNRLIFYTFTTTYKMVISEKFCHATSFHSYVNRLISFEVTPNDDVEVYLNQDGINYILDLLKYADFSAGICDDHLGLKEREGLGAPVCSPYLIGSASNILVEWVILKQWF
ncbi:MAG: hypothetical protein ACK4M7_00470 [Burkholderiales bacterium]